MSGSSVDLKTGEVHGGAIWCKSWNCEHCAPIRKKQLQAQAADGNPNKFITLTHKHQPTELTRSQAAQRIVHAWRMVIQRGKREGVIPHIQYIAVFEDHESGWPHLHILARCEYIPQKWLSDRMAEYIDSPVVDIRKVSNKKHAAWYVGKYVGKAPERFAGCKRYWRTLSYALTAKKPARAPADDRKTFFSQEHVHTLGELYQMHGYLVAWESENSFIALPAELDIHRHARQAWRERQRTPYKEK